MCHPYIHTPINHIYSHIINQPNPTHTTSGDRGRLPPPRRRASHFQHHHRYHQRRPPQRVAPGAGQPRDGGGGEWDAGIILCVRLYVYIYYIYDLYVYVYIYIYGRQCKRPSSSSSASSIMCEIICIYVYVRVFYEWIKDDVYFIWLSAHNPTSTSHHQTNPTKSINPSPTINPSIIIYNPINQSINTPSTQVVLALTGGELVCLELNQGQRALVWLIDTY